MAAANAMEGGGGRANLPSGDFARVKKHLSYHYAKRRDSAPSQRD
jgi:hypothetical protein